MKLNRNFLRYVFLYILFAPAELMAQPALLTTTREIKPLQSISLAGIQGTSVRVFDSKGVEYVGMPVKPFTTFLVGGASGRQVIRIYDNKKIKDSIIFFVSANTMVDDGGKYSKVFSLFHNGMLVYSEDGTESPINWRGKARHFLVPWILDNYHTMKGMQYFNDYGKNLIDAMHLMQRKDGMIWSFIASNEDGYYFETAYKKYGFFLRDTGAYFVRQPVENHVEYNYVCSIYKCWKASGDDQWMKGLLSSAAGALDYCMNDSLRWSVKYRLLKRALTIDSWDFQVDDDYTPKLGIGNPMLVVYDKTKFGIFYGDNTGYIQACNELADMYSYAGMKEAAEKYRARAARISKTLNDVCWNGKFFTHFIDEDSTVKRDLGVDMSQQFSQSNAYSINRGISHEKSVSIIRAYMDLRTHLPVGSPGEWYSIYPPFPKGFDVHDVIWQYMNGGVGGHVAGELALGALNNGYEKYGADILERLLELGDKYGQGKRVWFAYTGSFPSPPPVHYKPIDIGPYTNKDYTDEFPGLPTGNQDFNNIPFLVPDPQKAKSAAVVSSQTGYNESVTIPVNDTARTIYLLHTGMGTVTDNIYGTLTFRYTDSSEKTQYLIKEKHLTNWWFPHLTNDYTAVAWHGPNKSSASVGLYQTAIKNPEPGKRIVSITLHAAMNESIYNLFGITLADQDHYVKPKPESFGGPDNWAAATCMQALVEGLAGVTDKGTAYSEPVLSPRWIAANVDSINVTIKYAASGGYVSYRYLHDKKNRRILIDATGSGDKIFFHVYLPSGAKEVTSNNKKIVFSNKAIEQSAYVDFELNGRNVKTVSIKY